MKTVIKIEASKTQNYQKYTVGIEKEIDSEVLDDEIIRLQKICRDRCITQLELDKNDK